MKKKSHGQLTHAYTYTQTHTPARTRQWLPRDHVQHGRPRTTTTIISELSHEFSPCRNRVYGHLCSLANVAAAVAALDRAIDDAVVFHSVNIINIIIIAVVFKHIFLFFLRMVKTLLHVVAPRLTIIIQIDQVHPPATVERRLEDILQSYNPPPPYKYNILIL